MVKVITYGTYDLLHYGHIRLLERAKALGDYLIVAVTADDFDKTRGKINVQQSLMERIEAVRATGLADEIIVEEYEGQKIDDIRRYDIDIFTVGSDWIGKFDYLKEYCKVVYLERTEGISSSDLRSKARELKIGLVGDSVVLEKFERECHYVNGIRVVGLCSNNVEVFKDKRDTFSILTNDYDKLLGDVDAVYIVSHPFKHYEQIKKALESGKHVLCESPITVSVEQYKELKQIAIQKRCILMESLKTAYAVAYHRLLLLIKTGKIGDVISVDATCTSIREDDFEDADQRRNKWNSICAWGPTAMLPIFQILGTQYLSKKIISRIIDEVNMFDSFTKIDFSFPNAVASLKVGKGVKSEGELIVSGTKGYLFVPAPWWKTDYFEIRYENPAENKRYFYQLDGEGIRYEIVAFVRAVENGKISGGIDSFISLKIIDIIESYFSKHIKKI